MCGKPYVTLSAKSNRLLLEKVQPSECQDGCRPQAGGW